MRASFFTFGSLPSINQSSHAGVAAQATTGYTAGTGDVALLWTKGHYCLPTTGGSMWVYPVYSTNGGSTWANVDTGFHYYGPVADSSCEHHAYKSGRLALAAGTTYNFSCYVGITVDSTASLAPYCEILVLIYRP